MRGRPCERGRDPRRTDRPGAAVRWSGLRHPHRRAGAGNAGAGSSMRTA